MKCHYVAVAPFDIFSEMVCWLLTFLELVTADLSDGTSGIEKSPALGAMDISVTGFKSQPRGDATAQCKAARKLWAALLSVKMTMDEDQNNWKSRPPDLYDGAMTELVSGEDWDILVMDGIKWTFI